MSQTVTTVNEDNEGIFRASVSDYLEQGYKISYSSCGYYDTVEPRQFWMAILVKEEEE